MPEDKEHALHKLLDVVAQGVGAIARPWLIRREAKALAAAQESLGEVGLELQNISSIGGMPAEVVQRIAFQEVKRQRNIKAVVETSQKMLPASVSDDFVDPDWIARFFNHIQDVSNEDMQVLLAKMLSGEVARPGQFSLRTLEIFRNFTKSEAEEFGKICSVCLNNHVLLDPWSVEVPVFPGSRSKPKFTTKYSRGPLGSLYSELGLTTKVIAQYVSLGLIDMMPGNGWASTYRAQGDGFKLTVGYQDTSVAIEHESPDVEVVMVGVSLTRWGSELRRVMPHEYYPEIVESLKMALPEINVRVWSSTDGS